MLTILSSRSHKLFWASSHLKYYASTRAHEYLSNINLFRKDNEKGLKIGDLDFVAPGGPGYSDNCGVFSEDPITASLLQARLIELGHNTSVEIVDGTWAWVDADLFLLSNSFILGAFGYGLEN